MSAQIARIARERHQASGLLQRNRPMRLQLARPRRQFCSRELRGTKPVRRQTSLILANFSQLESSLSPQQQHSTHLLSISRARRWSLVSVRVLPRLVSSAVHDYTSLSSAAGGRMVAEAADPFSLSLSLSDCAEGVFASYQIMLAKESRFYFSFRRWRCNYFQASLGAPYIRRLVLFNHSGLW